MNRFSLHGSTAVVTGADRGIGRAVVERLLEAGADVIVFQRRPLSTEIRDLAASLNRSLTSIAVDLGDEESIRAGIAQARDRGPVDILVNNAGTQIRHDSVDFPLEDFDRVLEVNTRAVFQLCTGFGREMVARGHGKIINMASLLSFQGGLRVPAYAASKGAVAQLTKALCNEWASKGVNVNAIAPGYIDTEMNAALMQDQERATKIEDRIPAGRWGVAMDIADSVVFLASPAAAYVHGVVLPVDGGWLAR